MFQISEGELLQPLGSYLYSTHAIIILTTFFILTIIFIINFTLQMKRVQATTMTQRWRS